MAASLIVLLAMHLLAAVFWVGGMAFAHMMLRPAALALEPPLRLPLWERVLGRFLPWVGVAIVALLVSGFGMIFLIYGGFKGVPLFVHLMSGLGIVMMLLYGHIVAAPWRRFRGALGRGELPEAAQRLGQIRMLVGVNLVLGIVTLVVGATGRYWAF